MSGQIVWAACVAGHKDPSNCKADVYLTDHCSDKGEQSIATVYFDTDKGIKSIDYHTSEYKISGKDFDITLDGN